MANLSHLPPEAIDAIRRVLRGETLMSVDDAFEVERSLPAGHVNAALAMARRLGLAGLLDPRASRERDLCMAMILGRVIEPASKLGTVRALWRSRRWVRSSGVRALMRMTCTERWTGCRSARSGSRTASRAGTSLTGRWCSTTCPRVTSRGAPVRWRSLVTRATVSAVCCRSSTGCCVTWPGVRSRSRCSPANCTTTRRCPSQVEKLKGRFGLSRVVVVSDRGMVTQANIELMREQDGVDWITALKAPTIKKLARSRGVSTVAV